MAREVHDHAKYFAAQLPAGHEKRSVSLNVSCPKTVVLNEPAIFYGTAFLPVSISADGEQVRTVQPINGKFQTMLVFTKNTGDYHVQFESGGDKLVCDVTATV